MKHILALVILLSSYMIAKGEHYHYLTKALNGNADYHYTANSHITLAPGFSANPTNGHEVLLDIDSYDISPPSTGITGGAANNNSDGVVGTLGGNVDVSLLGGAVYTIPIDLPDGLGKIKPQLSISYNSQGRNGLLGWGWDLCGISSITRSGGSIYHDGYVSAVNYTDDRFCLDGQRLLMVNGGNYGGNGTSYRTELDQMSKIVSYHESGVNGTSYFKVWNADGKILYYGSSADSKALISSQKNVNVWLLKKVEDRYGNQMEYHYSNDQNSYRIDRITYSGNSNDNVAPAFTVKFHYENRDDSEIAYIGDRLQKKDALLKKISVSNGNSPMSSYEFTYQKPQPQNGYYYHLLTKVQYSAGQEHFNPTIIQWGSNNYFNTANSQLVMNVVSDTIDNAFTNAVKFSGDFNGDGFSDVVALLPNWFGAYTTANVFINKGSDNELQFKLVKSIQLKPNISWIHVADFNGDGLDDILCSYRTRTATFFPDVIETEIYLSRSTSSGTHLFSLYQIPVVRVPSEMVEAHIVGDFFGEGKCSFLIQTAEDEVANHLSFLYSYDESEDLFRIQPFYHLLIANRYYPADFDGDGITEILFKNDDGKSCIVKLKNDGEGLHFSELYAGAPVDWDDCFPGDYNGDGMTDALFFTNGASKPWTIWLSNRTGISASNYTLPSSFPYSSPGNYTFSLDNPHHTTQYIKIGDYDGNGSSDISLYYDNMFYVYYGPIRETSNDTPFANVQRISAQQFTIHDNMNVCLGNFLGQEGLSFLGCNKLSHLPQMTWRQEVKYIINGMGCKTELSYDYLMPNLINPSEEDFFHPFTPSSDPYRQILSISLPIRAMKKAITYNINGKPVETRCRYGGALLHKQGKGFLGFNQTYQEEYCNNQLQKTTTQLYEIFYTDDIIHPMITEKQVYNRSGQLMAKSTFSNLLIANQNNGKVFIPISMEAKEEYDIKQPTSLIKKEINEISYSTDCSNSLKYNEVLSVTRQAKGVTDHQNYTLVSSCEFQETTTIDYADNNLNTWLINRPLKTTRTIHRNGDYDDICSQKRFTYNSNKPYQITSIIELPNDGSLPSDPLATKTDLIYDPVGNIISKTISTPNSNLESKRELFEYSKTYGRRLLTKYTDVLHQTSTHTYDPVYNYRNSTTDCHGLTTLYEEDPLGVTSKTLYPDGTVAYKALRWGSDYYFSWEKKTGQPSKITNFAWTGDPVKSKSYDINGDWVFNDIQYDDFGRITRKTAPHRLGEDVTSTIYEYDEHNQVNKITHADGTYETIEQNGNTKSTSLHTRDGNIQSESKTFNIMGWVVKSTDTEGNSVINDYYPDGKPKWSQIEGRDETRMEMTYDALRNRTSLLDPNYGLTVYEYNAFGELTKQITPKMDETTYYYDAAGNLTKRVETDKKKNTSETTEWFYGSGQADHGLLVKVTSANQIIDYEYDSLLRLSKTTENCLGDTYHTVYTYDEASRISSIIYPSDYMVNYIYTSEGYLRCVQDSESHNLWRTSQTNALLQPTFYITGNGFDTHLNYNDSSHLLESICTTHKGQVIQDYLYEYDDYSNMIRRNDLKNSSKESFTYDDLNRLTSVTDEHGTSVFNYDQLGRMTSKSSPSGTVFTNADYSGAKPHAIKSVQSPNGTFPQARMDIVFNSFDKVSSISEGTNQVSFEYGIDHQRIQTVEHIEGATRCKTHVNNCEFIVNQGGNRITRTFLSGPTGIFAVAETINGDTELHYIHKDHLGSWNIISDSKGNIEQENHFDAWGNCDHEDHLLFDRGYTGHEHIKGMRLINMNGRLYDPVTSSMLSPDNNIQLPDYSQNLNRYSYCLNNPLSYIDPDGNSFIGTALALYLVFGTDYGYELQKCISPAAFHVSLHLSTQQIGIGFDISLGMPKSNPISFRWHFGATYYARFYDRSFCGLELRTGMELYFFGIFGLSGTYYKSGEITQTTNSLIIGNENWGVTYENDYMFHLGDNALGIFASDNGDRYRSAAVKIRISRFVEIGVNLFTGDPGLSHYDRNVHYDPKNNKPTYCMGRNGENPDEYRAGVLYVGYGPFRIGQNGEKIRNLFQNRFAHDFLCHGDSPYFKVLDRPGQCFFYCGTGTGNSLW
ncbi:MAG: VCBS repeat-containing protein [Bacteroidales bacterium]|nr:VCBS repeat-containing protein [Bacteroidales bacterium]